MSNTLERNSEILFLYDAMLTNPNGDPDNENRPRYDYDTQRVLVSDVRLKRYPRDYWINKNLNVFVSKVDGKAVTSTEKVKEIVEKCKDLSKAKEEILKTFVDIKYFGATITIKKEKKKSKSSENSQNSNEEENSNTPESIPITGPVQFTWGYSLHPTEILNSSTITSQLAGRESDYGTMGKDWRIKYALIGFYGIVSAWRAKETGLTDEDVKNFDKELIKALKLQATTRSKIGQTPRLYLRIEWNDAETFFGDLRNLVKVQQKSGYTPASLDDIDIDLSALSELLKSEKLSKVYIWVEEEFVRKTKGLEMPQGGKVEFIAI